MISCRAGKYVYVDEVVYKTAEYVARIEETKYL
jgi:hypothetical protein